MTFRKALLLAIAIVIPLSILLWLMFVPILFYALYPGLIVQMLISAAGHGMPTEALLGLFAGMLVNVRCTRCYFLVLPNYGQRQEKKARRPDSQKLSRGGKPGLLDLPLLPIGS